MLRAMDMPNPFQAERQALRDYLEEVLKQTGLKPTQLAKIADLSPSTLNKFLDASKDVKHLLSATTLSKIDKALQDLIRHPQPDATGTRIVPKPIFPRLTGTPTLPSNVGGGGSPAGLRRVEIGTPMPMQESRHGDMIPVRVASIGSGRALSLSHNVSEEVARPPALNGVRGAYAVRLNDSNAMPRYRPGILLHVHPARYPKPGDGIVAYLRNGSIVVREFVQRSIEFLELLEFTGTASGYDVRTVRIPGADIDHIDLIVGTSEA